MNNFLRLFRQRRIIILLVSVVGFAGVLYFAFRFFTPFGAVVSYQFNSMFNSDKLSKIQGAEETSSFNPTQQGVLQIPQQTIRQNAVTFNLKLVTKPVEGVWVNLKFKGNPKEIKIGVRGSDKGSYQYLPLYNQVLNSLTWNQTLEGGVTFWQRDKKYQDLTGLVSKPPVSDEPNVASYFFDPADQNMFQTKTAPLASSNKSFVFDRTLRGSHTFYVRVDTRPLNIAVVKQDANAYVGEDVLSMQLYKGQNNIAEQSIPDDGVTDAGGLAIALQKGEVKVNDIDPGVYRMVLKDLTPNADIRIKSIEVNQQSLVFQSPIFVVDEKPVTFWTNSKKITMRTPHTTGIQTVRLDGKSDLAVDKDNQNFVFDLTNSGSNTSTPPPGGAIVLHKLEIPKNDLSISGDGYFSLSKESFFNPEPIKTVDLSTLPDIDKIDYIIANYQQAKKDGDWYTAQAYFDPKDIKIDGDKLYFSLESPGLSGYGGEIVIDSLEVTVKKPGWFSGTAAQKTGGAVSTTSQASKVNANIFSQVSDWTVTKLAAIGKVVVDTFDAVWNWGSGLFGGPPTPMPTKTPTPKPILKSSPSPSSSSPAAITTLLVRVLNGGADKGAAASVSATLKNNGFTNVIADNAGSQNYTGVTINYRKEDINIAEKIESLLKRDYGTITKAVTISSSAEAVIILGKK